MAQESYSGKGSKGGWYGRPGTVRKVVVGLCIVCGLFLGIDLVFWITGFDKHPYFKWQTWPGFQAAFGFVACVLLVLVAKHVLRPLVMRGEDYYEKDERGPEEK